MARPDIAIMTFDLTMSGVVRNALRIADAANRARLQTEIWTVQDAGEMRSQVPAGVPLTSFGSDIGVGYSRRERKAAARASAQALASLLRQQQPRIALSAGNHFHELAAEAAKLARPEWTGRLIGRVSNALPRFHWTPHRLPGSLRKRVAARRRLNAMDRLITVSHALRDDLVQQLAISDSKISVIPNGIDLEAASCLSKEPVDHPWFAIGEPPVVLGVGRLAAQKDFATLIRASAEARKTLALRLLILGDGPEREALEGLSRELRNTEDVCFAGEVANPMPYFARASLFVLPSRWEGMSNALLEAMAVGCPVLATRCPGSAELLGKELKNQLVPVGDRGEMADAIVGTIQQPPERAQLIERAETFSLQRSLRAYVNLFEANLRDA